VAAAVAAAYLLVGPFSADLAAHTFRAELFGREGFALWNGQWYGGHHLPGYSLLFPPVAWALGPRLAGAVGAVAAAALFAALVRGRWGARAELGALWFAALGTASLLCTGRLAFGFGLAVGLASLLALQRGRRAAALVLALATALASPVAALFLGLAAAALVVAGSGRRTGLALAAAALGPVALLAVLFPEGGTEPFAPSSFWPVIVFAVLALPVLGREERVLRAGVVLYGVAALAFFVVPTPVGGNAARLGPLLAGPVAAAVLLSARRRRSLALLAVPLLAWQLTAPVLDLRTAAGDPSVHAGYYAGLLAFLGRQGGPPARLEIPFTRLHWEAARVAPTAPLARGWERQLDRRFDGLFYAPLTPAAYHRWLDDLAVRWVALPDVALDASAAQEARLLRAKLPYLRPVWRDAHWRVWELRRRRPLARGPARVTSYGPDAVVLRARHAGRVDLQVRWTRWWALAEGRGCVSAAPEGWTRLDLRAAGPVRLVTSLTAGACR